MRFAPLNYYFSFSFLAIFFIFYTFVFTSQYYPKPKSYHRIIFPEKKYHSFVSQCPFTFFKPIYTEVSLDTSSQAQDCWYNINFPTLNAQLHLSYYQFSTDSLYRKLRDDAQTFAFKHSIKASTIIEKDVEVSKRRVYGLIYELEGNVASWHQFFVSDSIKHYLRGALYFKAKPKQDSIQPILDFIVDDIKHLLKTFKWKKND